MNPPAGLQVPRRVLIVKPSSLGDVVTAMPILRGLKRSFKEAQVWWLAADSCAALVEHDSDLAGVIVFNRRLLGTAWRSPRGIGGVRRLVRALKSPEFDWAIDVQGLLRSALMTRATRAAVRAGFAQPREPAAAWFYNHKVDASATHTVARNIELARSLGIDAQPQDMTLQVAPAGRQFAEEFCRRVGVGPRGFLVAAPPARWPTKLYPARHWRTVVRALSRDLPVALIGSPKERNLVADACDGLEGRGVIDLSGQTDVAQMVGLIAASAGVICGDSAAGFIAPAVGVDCVTLIGPTRLELTGPYLRGCALVADVPCQGCLKRRCRHMTCMQSISPSDVIAAARRMLA